MSQIPISVTIITLNEECNISRCIGSVAFAADVVVVDSFSQDQTCQIAQSLGARVFTETWMGYGAQKELAASRALHPWILSLDADEVVSPELAEEIKQRFSQLDPRAGYLLPRRSYYLGRWIDHGGWYPDYQKRLYHREFSKWDLSPIHEKVLSPKDDRFISPLHHFVFKNISEQVQTNNKYSSLLAEKMAKDERKFGVFQLLVKPITKFVETYFWKRGFLDGLPGFIIAVSAAYSVFLKWSKLWEIERKMG